MKGNERLGMRIICLFGFHKFSSWSPTFSKSVNRLVDFKQQRCCVRCHVEEYRTVDVFNGNTYKTLR